MNHNRWLAIGVLAAFTSAGCGGTSEPRHSNATSTDVITINVHIDGFKKSKSGAT